MLEATLDSEINVWVRLLFLKFFEEKIKSKMTAMPRLILKSIKIVMSNFLRGGATFIPGATSIPESNSSHHGH